MRKLISLFTRLAVAITLVAAGSGVALANSIAVPNGTGGGQCASGNPNTARFGGNCGSTVTLVSADTTSAHVQDNSPSAETSYRARFYFNARQVTMASGDQFRLFGAYDGADPAASADAGTALVSAVVSFNGSNKQLTLTSPTDAGTATVGPINLFDAWHSVELEWTKGDGTNGHFNVWFDGKACTGGPQPCSGNSSTLDNNGQSSINVARWGAQYPTGAGMVNTGTSGSLRLDDFASQRSGYIGPALPFSDNATASPFWKFVQGVYMNEVIPGDTVSTFNLPGLITRRQMARFVLTAKHGASYVPPVAPCTSGHIHFVDIACADPDADWIQQFFAEGITAGCDAVPNYCPNGNINRGEMSVFLEVAAGFTGMSCPPSDFADVPTGSPFCPFIRELHSRGITAGCDAVPNFCPSTSVTRGQMSVFMQTNFTLPTPEIGP